MTGEITFKDCEDTDIEYLLWLRKETMSLHLEKSGLDLDDESHLKRIKYGFENARLIFMDDKKIGLLKVGNLQEYIEIIQIQIDANYQGRGIGRKIIQSIVENNLEKKPIQLSVLKENRAKKLYKDLGFKIIGENQHSFIMEL
ncbi:MAG: N-acetyltransferase [Flavobacterium sp.]|nr:MAG: N-acetyltransferase [Flavobacterium sp.]